LNEPARDARRGALRNAAARAWAFLRVRKKFWLVPIVLALLLLALVLLTRDRSALGPFIYTLF
jgi:hypothetical protein